MAFCKQCHYGSETMIIRGDPTNWICPNCSSVGITDKNPFSSITPKERRTLRDTRKERAAKMIEKRVSDDKFNFDERDIQQPLKTII